MSDMSQNTAALECGLGLGREQKSVSVDTSALTKRWYLRFIVSVLSSGAHPWLHCAWRVGWHSI